MPPKVWNDINLPGFSRLKEDEVESKRVTGVEDSSSDEEPEDKVRIVSAEWIPGAKGFQYNEQCFVDVTAEYLVETNQARIKGNLFGIYDGVEVDMAFTASGCIDDITMIARISIPKLYFINNYHYAAWQEDNSAPCQYVLKGIKHTLGANTIDSPILDMPNRENAQLKEFCLFLEMIDPNDPERQNDTFTLFSTDNACTYEQIKTIRDDAVPNNNILELIFTDLDENLAYTLELNKRDGSLPITIMQNRAYGKWAGTVDGLEQDTKSSGSNKEGFFRITGRDKDKLSKKVDTVKSSVIDKIATANDLKNSASSSINDKIDTLNDLKNQGQTIAMTNPDNIKQNADEAVNSAKSQVNDIKQNATQAVNNARSQVDSIKQNAAQSVKNVTSQTNDLKKQAESTMSLKEKLAAINTARENTQKSVASKYYVSKVADSLESVPTFNI
jgi:F0F1-type ATP synthase membrane subunit b/b'